MEWIKFLETSPFYPDQPELNKLEKAARNSVQKEFKTKQANVFSTTTSVGPNQLDQLVERISKLNKLLRITALSLRFLLNSARNQNWWKSDEEESVIGFGNEF